MIWIEDTPSYLLCIWTGGINSIVEQASFLVTWFSGVYLHTRTLHISILISSILLI